MRMIAAIAPLCATMPIFGARCRGGRSTLNSKVSAAPTREAAHADAVRPEHRDIRGARRGGELLLLGAAGVADLRVAGREHDRGADAAPPAGRDRIDHGRSAGSPARPHRRRAAGRRCSARRPSVDLRPRAADQMDVAGETAALQIGEHRAAHVAGLRRYADDRDRTRPQQAVEPRLFVASIGVSGRAGRPRGRACRIFSSRNCFMPCSRPCSSSNKRAWSFFAIR